MKAIVLYSGGLDSMLATRILQRQGIEVIGLNFVTPFHDDSESAKKTAKELGIELTVSRTGDDYMKLIAHPKWGYGKAVNPCIDCRIEMLNIAKRLMKERNASFVATGEIAGQRPNSQMQHQLNLISKESGLDNYLLRPLSATVLSPTEPEIQGWVNRKKLYGFTGRGRGRLISLGKDFNVPDLPQPSTGCFLCEKSYAPRLLDLFKYESEPTDWDAELLNVGRQIRINSKVKVVLGRNKEHCDRLADLFRHPAARPSILFIPETFNGPTNLMVGPDPNSDSSEDFQHYLKLGGALILKHTNPTKFDPASATVIVQYDSIQKIIPAALDDSVYSFRVI